MFVLQSTAWRGVDIAPLSHCPPFDWIQTGATWTDAAEALALAKFGQSYSWRDIVLLGAGLEPDEQGVVCSLYAGDVLSACGFVLERKGLTPGHLVQMFLAAGAQLRRVEQ